MLRELFASEGRKRGLREGHGCELYNIVYITTLGEGGDVGADLCAGSMGSMGREAALVHNIVYITIVWAGWVEVVGRGLAPAENPNISRKHPAPHTHNIVYITIIGGRGGACCNPSLPLMREVDFVSLRAKYGGRERCGTMSGDYPSVLAALGQLP